MILTEAGSVDDERKEAARVCAEHVGARPDRDSVLTAMVSGAVSPEEAAAELWSLADLQRRKAEQPPDEYLTEFRELAIELNVHRDHQGDKYDLAAWRQRMLALADRALTGVPFEAEGD